MEKLVTLADAQSLQHPENEWPAAKRCSRFGWKETRNAGFPAHVGYGSGGIYIQVIDHIYEVPAEN